MKEFSFELDNRDIQIFFSPVREKKDVIKILMISIKKMLLNEKISQERVKGRLILKIDKMSRLFFFSEKKYFSINFPFSVNYGDARLQFSSKLVEDIEHKLTSDIISLINSDEFNNSECIYTFNDSIANLEDQNTGFWSLFRELLLFEDGYVRYDFDEERVNGKLHPLHHIDLFYSQSSTFKVGLNAPISNKSLIDLVNLRSDCHYLNTTYLSG